MAKVRVKFRPSTISDRPGGIVYLVTHKKVVRCISPGIKLYSHEWDEDNAEPRVNNGGVRADIIRLISRQLKADVKSIGDIIDRFNRRGCDFSSDDVVNEFRNVQGQVSLFPFMEKVIDRLSRLNQLGTADNYRAALRRFRRFRNGSDLSFDNVDTTLMEDYQACLKADGLSRNSISFHMRVMRAVYNRAVRQGLTADRHPFLTVFTGMEKTRKRAITVNDIQRIRNLDLSSDRNLEFARDMFLFLFFCRGMSFVDAAFLKRTDIKDGVLVYNRHKTGRQLHVKVIRQIQNLLDRYLPPDSQYIFPIITNPGKNERRQYETTLRRVNNALKTIGEKAGLSAKLTTYVSRHSWATIAKTKNVPINIISDALGHESAATTQIYLASIDASVIDLANELVVGDM